MAINYACMVLTAMFHHWPRRSILDTAVAIPQNSVDSEKVYVPKSSSLGDEIVSGKLLLINTPSLKTAGTGSDPLNIIHWIISVNTPCKEGTTASCPHVSNIIVG